MMKYKYKPIEKIIVEDKSTNEEKLLDLANEIFKNSKPLSGQDLQIVNETFKKSLSKTPTKF